MKLCSSDNHYTTVPLNGPSLVLILQSIWFICTSWKRKQTMEQQPHRAREWTKSNKKTQNKVTSYSNWPRVLLFDLAHKQCNGIIKGWLHCLTSDSKGSFISMPGHGPNPIFFNKKIKIGRPEHSLTLHPLRPITSHFCLNTSPPPSPPPPTSKWTSYVYHP